MAKPKNDKKGDPSTVCPFCAHDYQVPHGPNDEPGRISLRRGLILSIHLMKVACESGPETLGTHLRTNYSESDGGLQSKQSWIWSCVKNGRESSLVEPTGVPIAAWKAWAIDHQSWRMWEWTTSRMKSGETENEQASML